MRRQICWIEKLDDGIKRDIRVSFPGGNKIKWQFKMSDRLEWDYITPPTIQDWDDLLSRAEARYNRRAIPLKELDMIRKARNEAAAG